MCWVHVLGCNAVQVCDPSIWNLARELQFGSFSVEAQVDWWHTYKDGWVSLSSPCAACAGASRLPLVAAIKGSEPHMPISLVNISAADSIVTVASHDGCLRHYRYHASNVGADDSKTPAASPTEETALRSAPDHGSVPSGSGKAYVEQGKSVSHAEAQERERQSESGPSGDSRECLQSGTDDAPADSLRALDVAEASAEACNGHMQRTDHDREERSSQLARMAEHSEYQQAYREDRAPGERSERGINSAALDDLNVEAVSALTVIESQLLYNPHGGRPDHLLSGFQVSSHPALYVEMPA